MTNYNRISSIDIMRGLTIFLMLFVNDLNMKVAPAWLGSRPADFDGMGLADWVFPSFLFLVGLAIPFSISKRFSEGQSLKEINRHVFLRFISLIIIGVLMLNTGRVNAELTGFSKNLWAILLYVGAFLIWNDYPDKENKFFTITTLKLAGIAILVFMVLKFKSGQPENNGSLITGWWGFLGLIGWGYLVSAFTYMFFRDSIYKTILITLFFLVINIISIWNKFSLPEPVNMIFGVILTGNVPFIVLSGLLTGVIIKKSPATDFLKVIPVLTAAGIFYIVAGLVLRNWSIISRINGTPSWALVCCGISLLLFTLIYSMGDVKKYAFRAGFIQSAGENSLTTYLAPELIYYLILSSGLNLLIYKQSANILIVVAGSVIWSLLMIWFTALLARLKIKLKL